MNLFPLFDRFWKICENNDNKRLAKQKYPDDVNQVCDIPYAADGNRYHLLDVYYPKEYEGLLPVIIDIHGGGWMYADKELNKNYNLHLAQKGYVVFAMSYRLVPSVNVREQLQDVFEAFSVIEGLLDEYPCDKARVFLTGDSAGGQLAGYSAAINESEELQRIFAVKPNRLRFSAVGLTSPVAYMNDGSIIGVYTRKCLGEGFEKEEWGSLMNFKALFAFGKLPPVFLVTSSGDILGLSQTKRAYADLKNSGYEAKLMYWPKTDGKHLEHVFSVLYPDSREGQLTITTMLEFFENSVKTVKK